MNIKETLRGAMRRIAGVSAVGSSSLMKAEKKRRDTAVAFHLQLVWSAGRHYAEADGLQLTEVFRDSGTAARN